MTHNFPYGRYVFEIEINVTALEKNFPQVLDWLKCLKMDKLLECPGHENMNIVKELYANLNEKGTCRGHGERKYHLIGSLCANF